MEFGAEKTVLPLLKRMPEKISHLSCSDNLALKLTSSLNLNLEYFNAGHIDNFGKKSTYLTYKITTKFRWSKGYF